MPVFYTPKLAINGFGRIGRCTLRAIFVENYKVKVLAVNTGSDRSLEEWLYLFKYDSLYGRFPYHIELLRPKQAHEIGRLIIKDQEIAFFGERDPAKLPWKKLGIDVVLECTGAFLDKTASVHLASGSKKVVLSAPSKDNSIPLFILGVNEDRYKGEKVISNGSCTTNCVAPIVKLIDEHFGFSEGVLTTIHAFTSTQSLVDGGADKDLRRVRAASENIIPTTTGAAESVLAVYPEAKGRFIGTAIRVPVLGGSYSDITFKLTRQTTVNEVNEVFSQAAVSPKLVGRLKVAFEPLVSRDILGNTASCLVDTLMTRVVSEDMIQIGAWYDNEWGYSCRLVEMGLFVTNQ